ncbi:hypothetical protein C8R46DRAFT_1056803 [Mycena filopes]|nr:hypothetical protein C8R46DRAFT_1056803 [Mycena filopes]
MTLYLVSALVLARPRASSNSLQRSPPPDSQVNRLSISAPLSLAVQRSIQRIVRNLHARIEHRPNFDQLPFCTGDRQCLERDGFIAAT